MAFKSLSDFKKRVQVGDRLHCENYRWPELSGPRTVHKVQTNGIAVTNDDGKVIWWWFPKASEVVIDGSSIGVAGAFTYRFEAQ
jgi:hypothetical protein